MNEETYKKILIALSDRREVTQYEIAKEVRLTYAPVHQTIERLLLAALIEEVRTEVGQGPLPKRYFRLTFPGLLTVLNFFQTPVHELGSTQLLEDESDTSNLLLMKKTRAAIVAQREFYPQIKFFLEWECLEEIFDIQSEAIPGLYDVLGNAVAVCIGKFRPLEKANLIEKNLKSTTPSFSEHGPTELWFELWFDVFLAGKWSSLTSKERLEELKNNFLPEYRCSLNKQMQRLFVRAFFNGLMTSEIQDARIDLASVENKVLLKFAEEYFGKEKNRRMASIKRFSEESDFILNLFAIRPSGKQPMG